MDSTARLVAALDAAGCRVGWYGRVFRCPAHADRSPSLSVREGTKGALFHCHAGCEPGEVLSALGLSWSDLFDEDAEPRERDEGDKSWVRLRFGEEWRWVRVDWQAGRPRPSAEPPPPFHEFNGVRVPNDQRGGPGFPSFPPVPPLLDTVAARYPEVDWLLAEPAEARAWMTTEPHLTWLKRQHPRVPDWAWTMLRQA